jgi:hypothetical protein
MATAQGTAPNETYVSGNTIPARQFTFAVNGSPAAIASARFAVRNATRATIFRASCRVSGGVVTRPVISAAQTKNWLGPFSWDIEVTLASGVQKTWIRGDFTMLRTDQY